jgi:hypothetical protein
MNKDTGVHIERNVHGETISATTHEARQSDLVDPPQPSLGTEVAPPTSKDNEHTWMSIEEARELSIRYIEELWRGKMKGSTNSTIA